MSNKLILDLTGRLTEALDQNYDVVNMDTVLAVISALEGATITKEQLETTRLANHINQLRRRNKSNILAIRAKNLLKKWREMFGITSQAQSEATSSVTQQAVPTQQPVPKPPLSSTSQPASPSPYAISQLLGENFDNSLSSIGVDFSRAANTVATGGISNTGSANFTIKKNVITATDLVVGSRSNGSLTKITNRNVSNNISTATESSNQVKHPTSFKNLISGFNVNNVPKQTNPSALSPKVPPITTAVDTKTFIIEDDDNQSQPSSVEVAQSVVVGVSSSPRTHKSMKRKDLCSPVVMTYTEHSSSPLGYENLSHEQTGRVASSSSTRNKNNQIITSTTIDLQDSNSSSNFTEVTEVTRGRTATGVSSTNKRLRKDKKRSSERVDLVTESEHFQLTIDESSRIAFPISGIQEYLSLSNSSMSIFPAGTGNGTDRFPTTVTNNNQPPISSVNRHKPDDDLTFAGKFKQSSGGIEVGSNTSYFGSGGRGEHMSVTSSGNVGTVGGEFPCENLKNSINNSGDSVSAGGGTGSASVFLPFSRNSNESSSNSRISQLDLIDVVNEDSQSLIAVDDLRHRQQKSSSNEKRAESLMQDSLGATQNPTKFVKDHSNTSKLQQNSSKEQVKSTTTAHRSFNASSKPSTPTSVVPIVSNAVSSPPVEQKVPKKRGRKKGSKGVDSLLAQSSGLSSQFLMSSALGSAKKVKTTKELLADIQNRKMGSATSSPTLMNWFGTSRPASSCSEPSLHSPRTSDANSTNATISTAARSTPEKNVSNNSAVADELYESDSDSNTSGPSHDGVKTTIPDPITKKPEGGTFVISSIEEQIRELMALLPPVDTHKIDWDACEDIPCTCTLREIPPEISEKVLKTENENSLELLDNMDTIKSQDEEEPVISVSVHHILHPNPPSPPHPTVPHHSQSAPVSAVTSPIVPLTNHKPMKSIFDLDFDDENDPLHSFVEAATKTKNGVIPHHPEKDDIFIQKNDKTTENIEHSTKVVLPMQITSLTVPQQLTTAAIPQSPHPPPPPQQPVTQQQVLETTDLIMHSFFNFPTYQVVEDPNCQAKQRYEVQTNQITKFHINAFHNCFIPNVNGNWDHSIPQNVIDDESVQLENVSLYANVVPKYGCFVKERIRKDLSHVKFTLNFRPNMKKKADKPPLPFLGVANIHRRQHFRLRNHLKSKKNAQGFKKRHKKSIIGIVNKNLEKKVETNNDIKLNSDIDTKVDSKSYIKSIAILPITSPTPKEMEIKIESNQSTAEEKALNYIPIDEISQKECVPSAIMDKTQEINPQKQEQQQICIEAKKNVIVNGNVQHLMNNNSIIKSGEKSGCTQLQNYNHNIYMNAYDLEASVATSRRSSSNSNSSLKQNQNLINMKLRRHRLKQRQINKQRENRKRKSVSSLTDAFELNADEPAEQPKVPPLIKRIKLVNGSYAKRRLTNNMTDSSCVDDDVDSYCYHIHSENEVITEEEDEALGSEIPDGDDDFEEITGDYDEEDGDDEDEAEEEYGHFHEVVTRDMPSSTTGNNHIVLTIKKTPSKTNSPSSSSMSPAPGIQPNANAKMSLISSPTTVQSTGGALLLDENTFELKKTNQDNSKVEIEKLLELNKIKAVDLISKADFFLPETTNVSVYNFQLKKNGDKELENEAEHDENGGEAPPNENQNDNENECPQEASEEIPPTVAEEENKEVNKKELENKPINAIRIVDKPPKKDVVTKAHLSESIKITKTQLRKCELKDRLREGIENAQKLHRQLFFPYELHTSIGSKILEINSCTSDCTDDESDNDTTNSSDSDSTDATTSSSSGNGNLKSRMIKKRRSRTKMPPGKRRTGNGGNPPSSSSSSSSSDSSSSSSSAFISWTTSDEDDDKIKKHNDRKPKLSVGVEKNENCEKVELENENQAQYTEPELPSGNNFLLRSFNHIYISTEERQRQQMLKQESEYRQHQEIVNSGYITLSGDDSKDETTSASTSFMASLPSTSAGYRHYYDVDPRHNVSNTQPLTKTKGVISISTEEKQPQPKLSVTITTPTTPTTTTTTTTLENRSTITNVEEGAEDPSSTVEVEPTTVIMSDKVDLIEPLISEEITITTNNNINNRINPDSSIGSINLNNNDSCVEIKVEQEVEEMQEELVAQEEYRTGMRQVDEDVDDEDGNNCARTQQFKEWHEVLQLRSYNDELLTVLPYVVIE